MGKDGIDQVVPLEENAKGLIYSADGVKMASFPVDMFGRPL